MKFLNPFRRLSPMEHARRELEGAERAVLDARIAEEYARCMASYQRARATLLQVFLDGDPV